MKIAVYCGSSNGNNPLFIQAAQELGEWIGKNGHTLVYGGGESGLMGEVSKTAKANNAYIIGVVPADVPFIANRPQIYCDEVIKAKNMSERKATMLKLADAFIALPGGIGTLDEISEAITLTKIGVYNKKSVFFNKADFYKPLQQMFESIIRSEFMSKTDMNKVCFAADIYQIADFLDK